MKSESKSTRTKAILALTLSAALAIPALSAAQKPATQTRGPGRYRVIDLGTLPSGTFSQPFFMNKHGAVSGTASLNNDTQFHAVLFSGGEVRDLGTLGGPNSIAFGINGDGQAAGEAETGVSDPNGEDFCGWGTHLTCAPFSWEDDVMTPLPTLGGNNGVVNQISDSGIGVGFAENDILDSICPAPQKLHIKPVVWKDGQAIELPTVSGDPDGMALGINDLGQVVGATGSCSTLNPNTLLPVLPVHAVLWEKGRAIDLRNLGGKTGQAGGNMAWAINRYGVVVGVSDLTGDATFHAFRWTKKGGMVDLGTVPGDTSSTASGLNDEGAIVGLSIGSGGPRAFLWRNGVMTDINTLTSSPLYLISACSINSRREIAGFAATSTGELHAYKAVPVDE